MGLLESKNWKAQEYYNEYLELKKSLQQLTAVDLDLYREMKVESVISYTESKIEKETERLLFVLQELELNDVSMKELVLLSCGIDNLK